MAENNARGMEKTSEPLTILAILAALKSKAVLGTLVAAGTGLGLTGYRGHVNKKLEGELYDDYAAITPEDRRAQALADRLEGGIRDAEGAISRRKDVLGIGPGVTGKALNWLSGRFRGTTGSDVARYAALGSGLGGALGFASSGVRPAIRAGLVGGGLGAGAGIGSLVASKYFGGSQYAPGIGTLLGAGLGGGLGYLAGKDRKEDEEDDVEKVAVSLRSVGGFLGRGLGWPIQSAVDIRELYQLHNAHQEAKRSLGERREDFKYDQETINQMEAATPELLAFVKAQKDKTEAIRERLREMAGNYSPYRSMAGLGLMGGAAGGLAGLLGGRRGAMTGAGAGLGAGVGLSLAPKLLGTGLSSWEQIAFPTLLGAGLGGVGGHYLGKWFGKDEDESEDASTTLRHGAVL